MRYLIYHNGESFFTEWFSEENNYVTGMVVFDFSKRIFTDDGKVWQDINEDHL